MFFTKNVCTVTFFPSLAGLHQAHPFFHSRFLSVQEAGRDLFICSHQWFVLALTCWSPNGRTQLIHTQIFSKDRKMVAKEIIKPSSTHSLVAFLSGDWGRQKHSPFDFLIETRSQNQLKSAPELERYNKTHTNIKSRH